MVFGYLDNGVEIEGFTAARLKAETGAVICGCFGQF